LESAVIDFSQSKIKHLIIHEIGNKLRDEKLFLSSELQSIDENLEDTLLYYFLKSFLSNQELFQFTHSSNLNLNEVYSYSNSLFTGSNETSFIENSQNIAKHLYEFTLHPKITKGELIIVEIENINYENESLNLIGIFKSENKDTFLKVVKDTNSISVKDDKGINTSKIEKGCLVLNYNQESGFVVLNIDNHNQHTEYWTHKFLNIKAVDNNSHKTKEIMQICKTFADDVLSKKYDRDTEFTFNNDYIGYFEENESFDIDSFGEVFQDDEIKNEFFEYHNAIKDNYEFDLYDRFELSSDDVKKEKRKVKNIIKLDTSLELKVLLDKENGTKNIERGFDEEKGMSYYKIFFNEEVN